MPVSQSVFPQSMQTTVGQTVLKNPTIGTVVFVTGETKIMICCDRLLALQWSGKVRIGKLW